RARSLARPTRFTRSASQSVAVTLGADASELRVTNPANVEQGELAVSTYSVARRQGGSPQALAEKAAAGFQPAGGLAHATADGAFVNFRIERAPLFSEALRAPGRVEQTGAGRTIGIDYSSPNIAKQLAYHHVRSTVIGQSLPNIHRALGSRVVAINHLGDWG